jgi:hypothetical protein
VWASEEYHHQKNAMRTLQAFLTRLEGVPGRKSLLYFQANGGIFPSRRYLVSADRVGDIVRDVEAVGAEANLTRTAVYVAHTGADDAKNLGANLADYTGGGYNRSEADLDAFVEAAGREPHCLYRIAIERPPGGDDVAQVRVLVRGRALDARYRVRFLDSLDRWWRDARAVLIAPERATDVRMAANLVPLSASRSGWSVAVRIGVDVASLVMLPHRGEQRGEWEVGALLEAPRIDESEEMLVLSSLTAEAAPESPVFVVHERGLDKLRPGAYRLGAFARDRNFNRFGGAQTTLRLPDPTERAIAGPVLLRANQPYLGAPLPKLRKQASPPAIRAERRRGPVPLAGVAASLDVLEALTVVCTGTDAPPDAAGLLRFVTRERDALFRFEPPRLEQAGDCHRFADRIELGGLSAGDYTYHVRWTGGPAADPALEAEAVFSVRPSE